MALSKRTCSRAMSIFQGWRRHSALCLRIATYLCAFSVAASTSDTVDSAQQQVAFSTSTGLYVINFDGSGLMRLLTVNPKEMSIPSSLAWSPDGKQIAFTGAFGQDMDVLRQYDLAFHALLYVIDTSGENLHRVTPTPLALYAFSPDGKRFLFQSSYEDPRHKGKEVWKSSAIYVVNADGTNQKRLTPVEGLDSFPRWSPDGSEIGFESREKGQTHIYFMYPDGSGKRRLTTSDTSDSGPVWSPDGKEIAYALSRPGTSASMYLINTDGTNERHIADNARPMAWTPDGSRLLIGDELHIIDRDGGNRVKLAVGVFEGFLSPDGRSVFYRTKRNGIWGIYCVDTEGQYRRQVTKDVGNVFSLAVSPAPRNQLTLP